MKRLGRARKKLKTIRKEKEETEEGTRKIEEDTKETGKRLTKRLGRDERRNQEEPGRN